MSPAAPDVAGAVARLLQEPDAPPAPSKVSAPIVRRRRALDALARVTAAIRDEVTR